MLNKNKRLLNVIKQLSISNSTREEQYQLLSAELDKLKRNYTNINLWANCLYISIAAALSIGATAEYIVSKLNLYNAKREAIAFSDINRQLFSMSMNNRQSSSSCWVALVVSIYQLSKIYGHNINDLIVNFPSQGETRGYLAVRM